MIFKLKKKLEEILCDKEDKKFEADLIISHVTKLKKSQWILEKKINKKQIKKCIKIAIKRKKGVPIQYLIKEWDFFNLTLKIGKGVLIPRQDTEFTVQTALDLIKEQDVIIDLGTGSGCIAAAIAKNKKNVKIFAVEKFHPAYKYAKKNLKDFKKTVRLIKGDILNESFAKQFKNIDLIISNPPYLSKDDILNLQKEVSFEPRSSLYGGFDGLKYYRKISYIYKNSLKDKGILIFEIGSSQAEDVIKILNNTGFLDVTVKKDLNFKNRVIIAKN